MGNTYRAGGTPIRLRSADADRSLQADTNSPLGLVTHADNYVIALRVHGARLVGEDARFIYEFTPADPATVPVASQLQTPNSALQTGAAAAPAAAPQTPNSEPKTAPPATVAAPPPAA